MDEKIEQAGSEPSRREVLTGARKKLKYVAPAMWVLAAAPEQAFASAPASGTCFVSGQNCVTHDDCCSLMCTSMGGGQKMCQWP